MSTKMKISPNDALIRALKNPKGTIINVALDLGVTIRDVSRQLEKLCIRRPDIKEKLEKRHWPTDYLSKGYIFDATRKFDLIDTLGERANTLHHGQYVLAEKLLTTNKSKKDTQYEIFLPIKIVEKEVVLEKYLTKTDRKTKQKVTGWFLVASQWILVSPVDHKLRGFKNRPIRKNEFLENDTDKGGIFNLIDGLEQGKDYRVRVTGHFRTRFEPGVTAGTINKRALVSVNYDWT